MLLYYTLSTKICIPFAFMGSEDILVRVPNLNGLFEDYDMVL